MRRSPVRALFGGRAAGVGALNGSSHVAQMFTKAFQTRRYKAPRGTVAVREGREGSEGASRWSEDTAGKHRLLVA